MNCVHGINLLAECLECDAECSAAETVPDEALLDIGTKVVEMADRVRKANKIVPGAVGRWGFELDGERYAVEVKRG